ncbi:MAG: hypothetical protein NC241_02565 [Bacteroides sp.]|nr:hypothetical protein [Bacteroides sp.]MCM1457455.1 hypothetical protein [Lachnoclostridium sp.]
MKRIKVILGGMMLAGVISAGANPFYNKSIVIHHPDLSRTAITIEQGMSTTFADGHLVLSHAKDGAAYEIRQPLSDVNRWTFSDSEGDSGLWETAGIADAALLMEIRLDGSTLHVEGAGQNAPVRLFSAAGVLAAAATGPCSMDLSALAPGVYVLSVYDKTFKIAVK